MGILGFLLFVCFRVVFFFVVGFFVFLLLFFLGGGGGLGGINEHI